MGLNSKPCPDGFRRLWHKLSTPRCLSVFVLLCILCHCSCTEQTHQWAKSHLLSPCLRILTGNKFIEGKLPPLLWKLQALSPFWETLPDTSQSSLTQEDIQQGFLFLIFLSWQLFAVFLSGAPVHRADVSTSWRSCLLPVYSGQPVAGLYVFSQSPCYSEQPFSEHVPTELTKGEKTREMLLPFHITTHPFPPNNQLGLFLRTNPPNTYISAISQGMCSSQGHEHGVCLQGHVSKLLSPAHNDLLQVRDLLGFHNTEESSSYQTSPEKSLQILSASSSPGLCSALGSCQFEILLLISDLALRRVNCSPPGWSRPAATPQ